MSILAFSEAKNLINFAKMLWKIENSEFSENYKNITSNLNFYFHEKNVPTRIFDQIVREFGMQGLNLDALVNGRINVLKKYCFKVNTF